jgi:hypothetical protein
VITPKNELDVSKIFLAYLSTGADALKTAHVAECNLDDVLYLAKTEMWDAKMERQGLAPGKNSEDFATRAREITRMANYVQALRIRGIIDQTIWHLYEGGPEAIEKFCSEEKRDGTRAFTTKPLVELTKAAETCHSMLYRSLGDVVAKDNAGESAFKNLTALHMTVVNHLQSVSGSVEPVLRAAVETHGLNAPKTVMGYLDDDTTIDVAPKS